MPKLAKPATDAGPTCLACYTPTTTALALIGSPSWFAFVCELLDIPHREAEATLQVIATENAPYAGGRFSRGQVRLPPQGTYVIALCAPCAARADLQVGQTANGQLPGYKEPDV